MQSPSRLVVFSKIPGAAPVKTRLCEILNESERVELAEAMLLDTLAAINQSNFNECFVCSEPGSNKEQLESIAVKHEAVASKILAKKSQFSAQTGSSFGERLDNCFKEHFAECSVAIIGSDCPMINPLALSQAYDYLEQGISCIGPTPDGGLWMIGLSASALKNGFKASSIFGENELDITNFASTLESSGQSFAILPILQDLDLPEDLVWLSSYLEISKRSKNASSFCPEFSLKTLGKMNFETERFSDDTRKTKLLINQYLFNDKSF